MVTNSLMNNRFCSFFLRSGIVLGVILMHATGTLLRADLTPIGYISIDYAVPIGGIDTIGIGNLTGLTYGCSAPAGFQVCNDVSISGSVTFEFQDGATVDTTVVQLASELGPGLYDPAEFQFLDSATLLSATFAGTITPTNLNLVLPDNSIGKYAASSDIFSAPLTPDQPLQLLQVEVTPAAVPEPDTLVLFGTLLFLCHTIRAARRGLRT